MSKKASPRAVRNPNTAEQILALIKALPPFERLKLFCALSSQSGGTTVHRYWREQVLDDLIRESRQTEFEYLLLALQNESRAKQAERGTRDALHRAEAEARNRIPKRGMTPRNRETLHEYRRLLTERGNYHGAKFDALRTLVTLRCEQGKPYVLKFRESCLHNPQGDGDIAEVWNHVKRLVLTDRRRRQLPQLTSTIPA